MLAAGCLMPLVLLAAGAVIGSAIGGSREEPGAASSGSRPGP